MDQLQVIPTLQGIRADLRDCVSGLGTLEMKLVGPRPADASASPPKPMDNAQSLLEEICRLASTVRKMIEVQHSIIGGGELLAQNAPSGRAYPS